MRRWDKAADDLDKKCPQVFWDQAFRGKTKNTDIVF